MESFCDQTIIIVANCNQVSGDNPADLQFRTRAASAGQQAKAHVSQVRPWYPWQWWWWQITQMLCKNDCFFLLLDCGEVPEPFKLQHCGRWGTSEEVQNCWRHGESEKLEKVFYGMHFFDGFWHQFWLFYPLCPAVSLGRITFVSNLTLIATFTFSFPHLAVRECSLNCNDSKISGLNSLEQGGSLCHLNAWLLNWSHTAAQSWINFGWVLVIFLLLLTCREWTICT